MAETKIEFSREGITFPYRRYLSDSASGFVLILLLFMASDRFEFVRMILSGGFPTEARAFVFLLLFLLSTPVGVVVNVISWILLEPPQKAFEMFFVKRGFGHFKKEYNFSGSAGKFGIGNQNWFERVRYLETQLLNQYPIYADKIESLRGIAIFIRNLSLISLVSGVCLAIWSFPVQQILALFALSVFLLYLSAVVSFYFHVQIVFWASIFINSDQGHLNRQEPL